MTPWVAAIVAGLLLPGLAAAQPAPPHPTVITLANGDHVSGLLLPSDGAAVRLKTDALGRVKLAWKNVAAIAFGDAIAVAVTDGRRLSGTAAFKPGDSIVITGDAGETAVALSAIARLAWAGEPPPTWRDYWNVSAASQLQASRGNSGQTDFGLDVSVTRQGEHSRVGTYASQRFSDALVADAFTTSADNATAGVRVDRDLSKRVVGFLSTDLQHDRFQQLERLWASAGIGWNAVSGDVVSFTVPVAVSRGHDRQLKVATGTDTLLDGRAIELSRTYNELQFGDSFRLALQGERGTIAQDLTVYRQVGSATVSADAGIGDGLSSRRPISGNLRTEFSASLRLQLYSWLGWQVSVHDSYNRQPYQNVKTNDVTIAAGLTFVLGRTDIQAYGGSSSNVGRRVSGDALPRR